MKTCNRCLANIDSTIMVCPYCGNETTVIESENESIGKNFISANERPLIVLRGKLCLLLTLILVVTVCTVLFVHYMIIHYGSWSFYFGWLWFFCLPYFLRSLNSKLICFYNDRVEVTPYLLSDLIIYYSNMRVNVHGNYRVTISKMYITSCSSPIRWFRDNFLETFGFSLQNFYLYEQRQIKEVMTILKKNASEYNIKRLS